MYLSSRRAFQLSESAHHGCDPDVGICKWSSDRARNSPRCTEDCQRKLPWVEAVNLGDGHPPFQLLRKDVAKGGGVFM